MPLHFITSSFLMSIFEEILCKWSFSTSNLILFAVSLSNSLHFTFWFVAYSPYWVRYSLSNTMLSTQKSLYEAVSAFNWKCLSPTTRMNSVSEPFTLAMVPIEVSERTPCDVCLCTLWLFLRSYGFLLPIDEILSIILNGEVSLLISLDHAGRSFLEHSTQL